MCLIFPSKDIVPMRRIYNRNKSHITALFFAPCRKKNTRKTKRPFIFIARRLNDRLSTCLQFFAHKLLHTDIILYIYHMKMQILCHTKMQLHRPRNFPHAKCVGLKIAIACHKCLSILRLWVIKCWELNECRYALKVSGAHSFRFAC